MVNEILNMLKSRIDEAEKRLAELEELIETAKEAGEHVAELEISKNELKERILKWKTAIAKRMK